MSALAVEDHEPVQLWSMQLAPFNAIDAEMLDGFDDALTPLRPTSGSPTWCGQRTEGLLGRSGRDLDGRTVGAGILRAARKLQRHDGPIPCGVHSAAHAPFVVISSIGARPCRRPRAGGRV